MPQYQLRTYLLMRTLSTLTDPEYQTDETFTNGEMAIGLFDTYIRSVATVKGLQQWEHILQNPPKIDFSDSL
ncbi:MAG: hypothetical protein PHR53_04905 [Bacteroidales bacterium]|nr:hypothetical protein [Bacteroidales bacterium]